MKKWCLLGFVFLICNSATWAQWDSYQATWEGQPGIVVLNMEWKRFAPVEDLPYLIVVQKSAEECDSLGFPDQESEDVIRKELASVDSIISLYTYGESVGTLTHNCKMREYFYVKDTIGLHSKLRIDGFNRNYNFKIIRDEEWKGYLEFLYPDDFLIQTMINGKAIAQLLQEGDDPSVGRVVRHDAGFNSEDDRIAFGRIVKERGFKILEESYQSEELLPYRITFSRRDKLEINWISEITLQLSQNAERYFGQYDGWEVEL